MNTIQERIPDLNQRGSYWKFQRATSLEIHLAEYRPLNGSSSIELPEFIKSKKAVINMESAGEECFKWSVTRAINPVASNPRGEKKSSQSTIFLLIYTNDFEAQQLYFALVFTTAHGPHKQG